MVVALAVGVQQPVHELDQGGKAADVAHRRPLGNPTQEAGFRLVDVARAGQIPLIIKLNSANSLSRAKEAPDQAVTGSVADALRLGCSAIGWPPICCPAIGCPLIGCPALTA